MSEDPNGGRSGWAWRRPRAQAAGMTSRDGVVPGNSAIIRTRALANAIVKAWSDDAFRTRLLTFPGSDMRNPNYQSTRDALSEVGVNIDKMVPVVLTPQQYATYRRRANQIIFVLPDPLGSVHNLATAQVAMCVNVFGM